MNMSVPEQIAAFEAKRAASGARMADIMAKANAEGRSLDEAESQEFDALETEVKQIDEHLARLKKLETLQVKSATPVTKAVASDPAAAAASPTSPPPSPMHWPVACAGASWR